MFHSYNKKEKFIGNSLKQITHYKDNEKHGEEKSWWDKHHRLPKKYSIYNNGKLIRTTEWYQSGQIKYTMNISNNKKVEIGFYNNGIQKFYKCYVSFNDDSKIDKWMKHGLWKGYYENSNVKYTENYVFDSLNGDSYYYHPDGNLKKIIDFSKNKVINNNQYGIIKDDNSCYYGFNNSPLKSKSINDNCLNTDIGYFGFLENDELDSELEEYIRTEKIFDEINKNIEPVSESSSSDLYNQWNKVMSIASNLNVKDI